MNYKMDKTRVIRSFGEISSSDWDTVAAVGNFDGIHLGHQKIIEKAAKIAHDKRAPLSIVTFEPHPRMLFQNDGIPFRLTNSRTKESALSKLGVQVIFELQFDQAFSQISAEGFVLNVLKNALKLKHVVCGYDFVFGHRRRGTAEILENLAKEVDIGVTRMPAISEDDGAVYSSTRVRQCLSEGDPLGAADLLGRSWSFSAVVERGDQRGRTIGFPTCNLRVIDLIQPAHGVYAVYAKIDSEETWMPGVANFGRRPTVNDRGALFEVNLFDLECDHYDKRLTISVVDFIRPEKKFSGLEELKNQIALDAQCAREILSNKREPSS